MVILLVGGVLYVSRPDLAMSESTMSIHEVMFWLGLEVLCQLKSAGTCFN